MDSTVRDKREFSNVYARVSSEKRTFPLAGEGCGKVRKHQLISIIKFALCARWYRSIVTRAKVRIFTGSLMSVLLLLSLRTTGKDKISLDELVSKHLDAIGAAEARAAVKSRVAQGSAAFNERISGSVHLDGRSRVLSEGVKFKCALQFLTPQYPGEQLVYDGQNVQIGMIDQQSRSMLGNFLVTEPEILREGLWGGSLNLGWPLLDRKASGAKFKYEGLKKVEGRELHEVGYVPKKRTSSGELQVRLYFDPETFHHVLTVYKLSAAAVESGATTDPSSVTTTVEERFSGFQTTDGVTLPMEWEIRARVEPGKAQEFQWKMAFTGITHNKL
jgi:hypothetical protein